MEYEVKNKVIFDEPREGVSPGYFNNKVLVYGSQTMILENGVELEQFLFKFKNEVVKTETFHVSPVGNIHFY